MLKLKIVTHTNEYVMTKRNEARVIIEGIDKRGGSVSCAFRITHIAATRITHERGEERLARNFRRPREIRRGAVKILRDAIKSRLRSKKERKQSTVGGRDAGRV